MLKFIADSFLIRGPRKTDGSYVISFETGEYQQKEIASILASIPPQTALEVTIKEYEG